ncbi:MAG: phosphoribosylformylglycinamidine synthase subunit PurQ [Pseudomonadota bacterium]
MSFLPSCTPEVCILTGYGLNCEQETQLAFTRAGARAHLHPINDVIATPTLLSDAQIFVIPGGFSYGDHTGAGNALACRLFDHLQEALRRFLTQDKLVLGICNGCQILIRLGLMTNGPSIKQNIAITTNTHGRYECRWVSLKTTSKSPWLAGQSLFYLPVAHGEGRFVVPDQTLAELHTRHQIALRYVAEDGTHAQGVFPANPNGSVDDIAGLTDQTGRVLALMPHPERAIYTHQRDDWPLRKALARRASKQLPQEADGMHLFKAAITYFS